MHRPTTSAEALAFLVSRSPSSIWLGLERMEEALEVLGRPDGRYPILQVAGTNGKGSTCAFASSCLWAHGLRVGRYTSPHLVRVNERIWISGEEISDETLGQKTLEVLERVGELRDKLTYFELGTLVALWHFAQERVDVAVLEVGLGGRLDATTATRPQMTAVSSIALDHTELLGNTLGLVAREKAGIFKPGVPAVVSAQVAEAADVLVARAQEVGAPLTAEGRDFRVEAKAEGLHYEGPRWSLDIPKLSLRGSHQLHNAGLALAALEGWEGLRWSPSPALLARALGETVWPGRFEQLRGSPGLLVDGAHNPAGVEALLAALDARHPGERIHLVFGVLADKDATRMRERLFPRCASVHLTPLPNPRSAKAEDSEPDARRFAPEVVLYATAAQALEGASTAARASGGLVVCAGSLVLVGLARQWAGAR